jgi:diguanylate cyclase (GGDEF)-like protein
VTNLLDEVEVQGLVLNSRDVTERRELKSQLRHQAFHDALTGLANRTLFLDRVEHALARRERSADPMNLLLLDLDDFRTINDSLGHAAGDTLLQEVAGRLKQALRPGDTVSRLGGDDFAILLEANPGDDNGQPVAVAERVLAFALLMLAVCAVASLATNTCCCSWIGRAQHSRQDGIERHHSSNSSSMTTCAPVPARFSARSTCTFHCTALPARIGHQPLSRRGPSPRFQASVHELEQSGVFVAIQGHHLQQQ